MTHGNKLDERIRADKSSEYAIKGNLTTVLGNLTMKFGEVQRYFKKSVNYHKKFFYEFLKFFDNFHTFIAYFNIFLEVIHMHTQKNYRYNVLLEIRNYTCNTSVLALSLSSYKIQPV